MAETQAGSQCAQKAQVSLLADGALGFGPCWPKIPKAAALETGFPLLSAQSGVSLPEAVT